MQPQHPTTIPRIDVTLSPDQQQVLAARRARTAFGAALGVGTMLLIALTAVTTADRSDMLWREPAMVAWWFTGFTLELVPGSWVALILPTTWIGALLLGALQMQRPPAGDIIVDADHNAFVSLALPVAALCFALPSSLVVSLCAAWFDEFVRIDIVFAMGLLCTSLPHLVLITLSVWRVHRLAQQRTAISPWKIWWLTSLSAVATGLGLGVLPFFGLDVFPFIAAPVAVVGLLFVVVNAEIPRLLARERRMWHGDVSPPAATISE